MKGKIRVNKKKKPMKKVTKKSKKGDKKSPFNQKISKDVFKLTREQWLEIKKMQINEELAHLKGKDKILGEK